jgi:hypothetical protein
MNPAPDLPRLTWEPDALEMFCRCFGMTRAEAKAAIEEENEQMAADWAAYRRRNPHGTVRAFGLERIEAITVEMLIDAGVPPPAARVLARNTRRRAEEHAL